MALTKEDLQAIGELMDSKLKSELAPINERLDAMQTDLTRVAVTQENIVLPRIQLLAEGHTILAEKLDRLEDLPEQVEDIQNTVSVLKQVFRDHTHK